MMAQHVKERSTIEQIARFAMLQESIEKNIRTSSVKSFRNVREPVVRISESRKEVRVPNRSSFLRCICQTSLASRSLCFSCISTTHWTLLASHDASSLATSSRGSSMVPSPSCFLKSWTWSISTLLAQVPPLLELDNCPVPILGVYISWTQAEAHPTLCLISKAFDCFTLSTDYVRLTPPLGLYPLLVCRVTAFL